MNNQQFLNVLQESFVKFLETHSRSNEKLKILHGAIAKDLAEQLGSAYTVQSLGYGNCKEGQIKGRYIDKNVDIVVTKARDKKVIAGIAIKFVMQNYAQNANNYFENMLGETANIQSEGIPYFQIFIIPAKLPYYQNSGEFSKWETFDTRHLTKYQKLSYDNNSAWVHPPAKTLIYVIELPEIDTLKNKTDYIAQYLEIKKTGKLNFQVTPNSSTFGNGLIYNNYEIFIEKIVHRILSE